MAYTNKTEALELPQWVQKDHPDFLTDMNEAMRKIDTGYAKNAHDHSELKEQVDALAVDFVEVKTTVAELKEKVDNLVDLEDNPTFIALKTHVDTLQDTVEGIIQTDNRQDIDIQNLQTAISRIDLTIGTIENHLDELDSHFDIHDKELADIKANVLHIQNDVDDLRTHVAHLEESVSHMETEVGHIKGEQITQNDRLDALEAGKTEQNEKISAIETKVSEQDTKISTIEQTARDADVTAEAALEEAMNAVSTANGASAGTEVLTQGLAAMGERVDGIDERVGNNTTSIGNLNSMYETLDGRMDTLEQSDTKQNADIGRVEGKVDKVESQLNAQAPTLESIDSRVTNLEVDNTSNKNAIGDLQQTTTNLNTRLTTAEEDIQELKDRPSGGGDVTTEQFNQLADRVAATETKNTEQDTAISTVETTVGELKAQVVTASEWIEINLTSSPEKTVPNTYYIEGPLNIYDMLMIECSVRGYSGGSSHRCSEIFSINSDGVGAGSVSIDIPVESEGNSWYTKAIFFSVANNVLSTDSYDGHIGVYKLWGHKKASSTALSEAVVARLDTLASKVEILENTTIHEGTSYIENLLSEDGNASLSFTLSQYGDLLVITPLSVQFKDGAAHSTNYFIDIGTKIESLVGYKAKIRTARFAVLSFCGGLFSQAVTGGTIVGFLQADTKGNTKIVVKFTNGVTNGPWSIDSSPSATVLLGHV